MCVLLYMLHASHQTHNTQACAHGLTPCVSMLLLFLFYSVLLLLPKKPMHVSRGLCLRVLCMCGIDTAEPVAGGALHLEGSTPFCVIFLIVFPGAKQKSVHVCTALYATCDHTKHTTNRHALMG